MQWNQKYRPKKISELFLDSTKEKLLLLLNSVNFPQVILCAGPKGLGKTTTARILATIVNDPKNKDIINTKITSSTSAQETKLNLEPDKTTIEKIFSGNAINVRELDAASNRGIDDIRRLQETIYLAPAEGNMQVIILDEVHMLTTEAFNALLKLLEEPPEHVLFILATTELHKIPETIISRASVIDFPKATSLELIRATKYILDQENIDYQDDQLEIIATLADGSFRDMIKITQLHTYNQELKTDSLNQDQAHINLAVENLLEAILYKDIDKSIDIFQQARNHKLSPKVFYEHFVATLHQVICHNPPKIKKMVSEKLNEKVALFLLREFLVDLAKQNTPLAFIGIQAITHDLIIRAGKKNPPDQDNIEKFSSPDDKSQDTSIKNQEIKNSDAILQSNISASFQESKRGITQARKKQNNTVQSLATEVLDKPDWKEKLLTYFRDTHPSIFAVLQSSNLSIIANNIVIEVYYSLHQDRLETKSIRSFLEEAVQEVLGQNYAVLVQKSDNTQAQESSQDIAKIAYQTLMK